jgi:hypothetical protein
MIYVYLYIRYQLQVIGTVKYADDLVPQVGEENVLQGVVDRLIEIGRRYGMEMNVGKN